MFYFISILLSLAAVIGLATAVSAVEPIYSDTNPVVVSLVLSGTAAYS